MQNNLESKNKLRNAITGGTLLGFIGIELLHYPRANNPYASSTQVQTYFDLRNVSEQLKNSKEIIDSVKLPKYNSAVQRLDESVRQTNSALEGTIAEVDKFIERLGGAPEEQTEVIKYNEFEKTEMTRKNLGKM